MSGMLRNLAWKRVLVPAPFRFLTTRNLTFTTSNLQSSNNNYPDLSKIDPILDFPDESTSGKPIVSRNQIVDYPSFPPPPESLIEDSEEVQYSEDLNLTLDQFKLLKKKVLVVRRTVNMTSGGKIPSMSALVVVGNGRGSAGYAEAKAENAAQAVKTATQRAIKNITYFERYDNRTLYHDVEYKFKATKLKLFARPPGFGVRTNLYIHEICRCIGYHDLGAKVMGSRNPMNVIKAFFDAIQLQKTPDQLAMARGKRLVDVQARYYGIQN